MRVTRITEPERWLESRFELYFKGKPSGSVKNTGKVSQRGRKMCLQVLEAENNLNNSVRQGINDKRYIELHTIETNEYIHTLANIERNLNTNFHWVNSIEF